MPACRGTVPPCMGISLREMVTLLSELSFLSLMEIKIDKGDKGDTFPPWTVTIGPEVARPSHPQI